VGHSGVGMAPLIVTIGVALHVVSLRMPTCGIAGRERLHAIFERAVIDQVIPVNPCRHTVRPKMVKKPKTAITPEQFEALLAEIPDEFRLMVLVVIETGVRWGELARCGPSTSTSVHM